jgi:hemerythrin superfamily protein
MATTRTAPDACTLLDADHKAVKKMFKDYDDLASSKAKSAEQKRLALAREICQELTVHATIEEEIFYPALRAVLKETELLAEAEVEHAGAKDLIAQIESMDTVDEMFDAKVKVLGEYIDHHVKEERNEIFPKARAARGLDLIAMREDLQVRKDALMGVELA